MSENEPTGLEWLEKMPEDMRENETLVRFKAEKEEDLIPMPLSVAKSYLHARSLVGADTYKIPKTDEEWEATFTQLGRPENKDLYILQAPADLNPDIKERVGEDAEWFRETAHKLGLNDNQASKLFAQFAKRVSDKYTTVSKVMKDDLINTETQLRVEYGQTYDAKNAIGDRALKELGGEKFVQIWNDLGLESHPEFKRIKFKIGELIAEDLGLDKTTGQLLLDKSTLQDEANKLMRLPEYIDKTKPGHVETVNKVKKLMEQIHGTKPVVDVLDRGSIRATA